MSDVQELRSREEGCEARIASIRRNLELDVGLDPLGADHAAVFTAGDVNEGWQPNRTCAKRFFALAVLSGLLSACQTPRQPDPSLALAIFEATTPQRVIHDFGENLRSATAISADRIIELPRVGSPAADEMELERLELRFTEWCKRAAPGATPGSYPYGRDMLVQDISAATSSQTRHNAPLLTCMGPDGRSLAGAYVVLADMRVAFYDAQAARRLHRGKT